MNIKQAIKFVWKSSKRATLANGLLILLQGLLPLPTLYLMKLTVDTISLGVSSTDKGTIFTRLLTLIILMGLVALANNLIGTLATLSREWQSQKVTDYMSGLIHAKSVEVDLEYYENAEYHNTLHRAQLEASYRPTQILNGLLQVGKNLISLIAIAALLFSFHWAIAAILFAAVIPNFIVKLKYSNKLYRWQTLQTAAERQANYVNWILTGAKHAKEMRLFDLGPLFMARFRNLRKKLHTEKLELLTKRSTSELIASIGAALAIYGSYAYIAHKTVQGAISLGALVMYFQAFQRGQAFLQELLSGLAKLYEDSLFIANLCEFLELKQKVIEPLDGKLIALPLRSGITFNHVSFNYPGGTRKVLEDINLTIHPGEVIALVGDNGSGKTTLIKLLCRLYDPASGTITIDGTDLRQFKISELRREITVIFQDYIQYNLTARENIWLGNTLLSPYDKRITCAARNSGAEDVINSLPKEYETVLGKLFEQGEELSVGEWQKIALARAFMSDAQIMILDEPTSSIDAKTEYAVFKNFSQLASGRTSILISHRFSTVRMANRIFVMNDGKITESGSHEELMEMEGNYANLFETQAQYYR